MIVTYYFDCMTSKRDSSRGVNAVYDRSRQTPCSRHGMLNMLPFSVFFSVKGFLMAAHAAL